MNSFSVLMSVYIKEKPEYLEECFKSLEKQTALPQEIILVQDGPITENLKNVITTWKTKLNILDVILEENRGLGPALNTGLKHCSNDLVARMDTDDICLPYRFELQVKAFENRSLGVIGSAVSEFENNPETVTGIRKVPISIKEITQTAKLRNPINHPSVMYRKSIIERHGGYEDVPFFEDYFLWLKLLNNGIQIKNIEEPLVKMRAGSYQLARRGGINYIKKELNFLGLSLKRKYITFPYYLMGLIVKIPIRLLPRSSLSFVYKKLRD